jgi:hypothetical protein
MTYLGDHTKNKTSSLTLFNSPLITNGRLVVQNHVLLLGGFERRVRRYHTIETNQLGYYLAGLIEGDGSIILRTGDKESTSPKIVFTFHNKEIPMYDKLKQTLGTGVIYREKNGVCRYSITNADAVINVINLVNGKFRTPKIQALYKAIDNLNK